MASIILIVADDQLDRVINALCIAGGWTQDSGVTKGAFAKAFVVQNVKSIVKSVEYQQAEQTALASVVEPTDADIS
jgi:hypothetical protein